MYYIRDRETGLLLRGVGGGKIYRGKGALVWGNKDTTWAKVFKSVESARRCIEKYGMENVDVLNVVMMRVWSDMDGGSGKTA